MFWLANEFTKAGANVISGTGFHLRPRVSLCPAIVSDYLNEWKMDGLFRLGRCQRWRRPIGSSSPGSVKKFFFFPVFYFQVENNCRDGRSTWKAISSIHTKAQLSSEILRSKRPVGRIHYANCQAGGTGNTTIVIHRLCNILEIMNPLWFSKHACYLIRIFNSMIHALISQRGSNVPRIFSFPLFLSNSFLFFSFLFSLFGFCNMNIFVCVYMYI